MIKVLKFKWKELKNEAVIAIPVIGDYEKFVDENYMATTGFLDSKTLEFTSYEDRYINMLNEGKVLLNKNYLVFKEGYHKEYLEYAIKYIEIIEDKDIFFNLKDISNYNFVSNLLKIAKKGIVQKDRAIETLSKYFINEDYVANYI